jgi:dimethylargininase
MNTAPPISKQFTRAIVRLPGSTFAHGLTSSGALGAPDIAKALEQHAEYCQALRDCGLTVLVLPADEHHPDSTFVEDTAVIADRVAIITRPGAPSRAGEVSSEAAALHGFRPRLVRVEAPGTVDGGDICEVEGHFLIGLSDRTNDDGARQLQNILVRQGYSASTVDIRGQGSLLHLKSGISYLGEQRFVVAPGFPRTSATAGYELVEVAHEEAYAANCIRVNDSVLIASGFPKLESTVAGLGYRVRTLDTSEFRKMDGGLSCLSLRFSL